MENIDYHYKYLERYQNTHTHKAHEGVFGESNFYFIKE